MKRLKYLSANTTAGGDMQSDCREAEASEGTRLWMQRGIFASVCALVIGVYAYTARSGYVVSTSLNAGDEYYNLLMQGFRAGQLNLKKQVPPGLASLADPYNPSQNAPYRTAPYGLQDVSYYKDRLYIYFGAAPAVALFWPYVALTGHYLSQKYAAVIFCLVGFLTGAGLLYALWRRYFAEVHMAVLAAGTLAFGLATYAPFVLARIDVYEVAISCGYALTMLALAAIWKALHESKRTCWWLATASLAYGLAVGARPSLLFGAVILLMPVAQAWRERRMLLAPLLAATVPMTLIGLGLMLYNALRFDSPLEFGLRYALSGDRPSTVRPFGLRHLWFHFRVYFLEPARWSSQIPFVHDIRVPRLPAGHGVVEHPFGVLTNVPLVWLALAMPLAMCGRSAGTRSTLCGFLVPVGVLFGATALTLSLFFSASIRYEMEFLPSLMLLGVIGILSLERALSPTSEPGQAHRLVWRHAARWGWGLLLAFSVAFNLLASFGPCADAHAGLGLALARTGRVQEAIEHWEQTLRLKPDYAWAHNNLGATLMNQGRLHEAISHLEQALRLKPDFAAAHNNLGNALTGLGRLEEAIGHYEQALRIRPNFPEAHYNLGLALEKLGRNQEAIPQYEQALRIRPDYAEAQSSLARARAAQ
jgi:tetratricopeptide (TPR) repeat protein